MRSSDIDTARRTLFETAPKRGHWFHSIELSPGVWTAGFKAPEQMKYEFDAWGLPADLTGKTVLDIGCADGAFSIAALRRGAASVLSIDEQMTTGMGLLLDAQIINGLNFKNLGLFSNEFMQLPQYDLVIFAGVLYHVHDMLEALKRVRARTRGAAILETHVNESMGSAPPMAVYYETDELGADPTNWWGPNVACLEAMLRTAGFESELTSIVWQNSGNGRPSYRLTPTGSVFADVTGSATGSNSLLEEARNTIKHQSDQIVELQRQLLQKV